MLLGPDEPAHQVRWSIADAETGSGRSSGVLARFPPGPLFRPLLDALAERLHVLAEAAPGGAPRQADRHEAAEHDAGPHEAHSLLDLFHLLFLSSSTVK